LADPVGRKFRLRRISIVSRALLKSGARLRRDIPIFPPSPGRADAPSVRRALSRRQLLRLAMTWAFQPLLPSAAQQQASGADLTLIADTGSFGLTGQDAAPKRAVRLPAVAGALVLAAQAAGLRRGFPLAGSTASIVLTGQPALFLRSLRLTAAQGAIAVAGQAAPFDASGSLAGDPGLFSLTGQSVTPRIARRLAANAGAFAMTGAPAGLAGPPRGSTTRRTMGLGIAIGL
jgi:hypothetical protein